MAISRKTTVKDLTIEELETLIHGTVKRTIEDAVEDFQALTSVDYIKSIEKARNEYKEGKIKSLEDLLDDEI